MQHRRHYVYMADWYTYRTYCGRPSRPVAPPAPWNTDTTPLCGNCRRAMAALNRQRDRDLAS